MDIWCRDPNAKFQLLPPPIWLKGENAKISWHLAFKNQSCLSFLLCLFGPRSDGRSVGCSDHFCHCSQYWYHYFPFHSHIRAECTNNFRRNLMYNFPVSNGYTVHIWYCEKDFMGRILFLCGTLFLRNIILKLNLVC